MATIASLHYTQTGERNSTQICTSLKVWMFFFNTTRICYSHCTICACGWRRCKCIPGRHRKLGERGGGSLFVCAPIYSVGEMLIKIAVNALSIFHCSLLKWKIYYNFSFHKLSPVHRFSFFLFSSLLFITSKKYVYIITLYIVSVPYNAHTHRRYVFMWEPGQYRTLCVH